ncbi:hypothetical protein GLAREA_00235 [Glarea lozoyensis ATCC 20868]|uniref:Complex 1 LYR protein domain-containing protein n=1 Tax=Glarea lozoyensis (strain ATCC 20868 / MF5171) TaxID=1116229 RepID=S3CRH3_GLAL2|nr:uncharacterized protein GLAREA_00235 [Glarea lozoyensis ATCC 20868]EPE29077.1 hypothetical protein GLAREA_00235 [Glarea lozoyensis ATCC 20868]
MVRYSGLQKEVFALYRQCLRVSRKKPESSRAHFESYARNEFKKSIGLDKKDFGAIEYLLRKGRRQVEIQTTTPSAAEEVLRTPLSAALQQERRKQRQIARSRSKSSPSSIATSSRRKGYGRMSRNIQFVGKQNLRVRNGTRSPYQNRNVIVSSDGAGVFTKRPPFDSTQSTGTVLDFGDTDIPCGSQPTGTEHHNRKDIRFASRGPVTRISKAAEKTRIAKRRSVTPSIGRQSPRQQSPDRTHTRAFDKIHQQKPHKRPQVADLGRSYDPRIDPCEHIDCTPADEYVSLESAPNSQAQTSAISSAESSQKTAKARFNDATLWETIDSTRFPPDDASISTPVPSSDAPTSNVSSRNRKQARQLTRFQKQLELHYKAVSSLPKQSLVLSPSATTISANTVKAFLPYHTQFKSAGLAITSHEQQRKSLPPKRNSYSPCIESIADRKQNEVGGNDGHGSFVSGTTGTTGTTILGFTPPHEKTYGVSTKDRARSSSASDYTAVGFTPPHEKMISRPVFQQNRQGPISSNRNNIPWLQRQDVSPKQTLPPPRMSKTQPSRYKNSRFGEPPASYQGPKNMAGLVPMTQQTNEVEQNPLEYSEDDQSSSTVKAMSQQINEKATQTEPASMKYVDARTQTVDEESTDQKYEDSLTYLCGSTNPDKDSSNNTARHTRVPTTENAKDLAATALSCTWKRSRLPWERPKRTATPCPMAASDHGVNGDPCDLQQDSENPTEVCSTVSDAQNCETPISQLTPRLPTLAPVKCLGCEVLINKNENLDGPTGQAQSNSISEDANAQPHIEQAHSLCQQCSQSVYTAYVVTPSRKPTSPPRHSHSHTHGVHDRSAQPQEAAFRNMDDEEVADATSNSHVHKSKHRRRKSEQHSRHTDPVKQSSIPRIDPSLNLPSQEIEQYGDYVQSSSQPRKARHIHWPHSQRHGAPAQQSNGAEAAAVRHYTSSSRPKHHTKTHGSHHMHHAPNSASSLSNPAPHRTSKTTNQKVFDGLQVATAAACDKDLDAWLIEVNGTGVRHFLANLSKFEPLGVNALSNVAKRAARDRREQLLVWEKVREQNLMKQEQERTERHIHRDKHTKLGLDMETDGPKGAEEARWILEDSGLKKDGKGGFSLGKEGIVRDD